VQKGVLPVVVTAVALTCSALSEISAAGPTQSVGPLATPPATQPVAKKLNPELLNLPENTWVHLRPARNPAGR